MPVELVIAPEAELDIAEACAWYEGRRVGLGDEFLSSVDACLERILYRPGLKLEEALARIEAEIPTPETRHLVAFVRRSERGICRE
jgi:hypothetical protein